ncbi:MAG: hypothetical protein ACE5HI_16780 [bacterium]
MATLFKHKIYSYLLEIGKWVLVLWLILPLKNALQGSVDFGRVALGVVLFIIFAGKMLYDVVFFPRQHQAESSAGKDLLSMVGIVVGMAFIVLILVFFVALYVIKYMNNTGVK